MADNDKNEVAADEQKPAAPKKASVLGDTLDKMREDLDQKWDAAEKELAPLRKEREKLVAKIQPLEKDLQVLDARIKDREADLNVAGIGNDRARLARMGGAKTISNQ